MEKIEKLKAELKILLEQQREVFAETYEAYKKGGNSNPLYQKLSGQSWKIYVKRKNLQKKLNQLRQKHWYWD